MLFRSAPHIVEAAASAARAVTGAKPPAATESKMVALVVDPSVVGTELVAPVRPGEIPAFEPPAPAVSAQVPDYERVPRPAALSRGDDVPSPPRLSSGLITRRPGCGRATWAAGRLEQLAAAADS